MKNFNSFSQFLNIAAKKNEWDDWNDVLHNASFNRTKNDIMEQAFVMYQEQMKSVISYDDKDEDEKLQSVKEILNLDQF